MIMPKRMPEHFMYILILFRRFDNIITNSNVLKVKTFFIKKLKLHCSLQSQNAFSIHCTIQHQISENILQVYTGKTFY